MTRDELIDRVSTDAEQSPHMNIADLVFRRGADPHRPLCPQGCVDPTTLYAIDIEANADRMKTAPFAGGSAEQPGPIIDALRIISHRRALHQRRTMNEIQKRADKR